MKTSSGIECAHEDQLIPGLCSVCDTWGLTHGTCEDCSLAVSSEGDPWGVIGPDKKWRCEECHDLHRRQWERASDEDAWDAHCDQKLSEWKDEGRFRR